MKITRVTARAGAKKREKPSRDALQVLDTHGVCQITIETDEGISGQGTITFGRLLHGADILAHLVNDELAPEITGEDPALIRGIRDKLWRLTEYHGTVGLALFGIAGIDLALWDLAGRAVERPVWKLLGAYRDRVPAYAMVGWLEHDIDGLKRITAKAAEQGFRGIKMKVGASSLSEEVERIESVQETIGPDGVVMVDANQVFSLPEALQRGKIYQELGCFWFEEPLRADDIDGLAALSRELTLPIASGENNYGIQQFRHLFERRAVDIVQPDIRRAGGLTECLEIGLMARGFNVPYASHGGGAHIHVLAALPNAIFLESGLLPNDGSIELVDGCYPLPTEPGLGAS